MKFHFLFILVYITKNSGIIKNLDLAALITSKLHVTWRKCNLGHAQWVAKVSSLTAVSVRVGNASKLVS